MNFLLFVVTFIAPGTGQAYKSRWRRAWGLLACAFVLPVLCGLFWGRLLPLLGLQVPAVSYGGPPWQIMVPIFLGRLIALGVAVDAARLPALPAGAPTTPKIMAFFLFSALLVNAGPRILVYALLALSHT